MIAFDADEFPRSMQLYGVDPVAMGRAAQARVQTAFALEPVGRALRDLLVGHTTTA